MGRLVRITQQIGWFPLGVSTSVAMTARIGNCLIWHCFNQGLLWTGAGKVISQKDSFNLAGLAECLGILRRLIVNVPSSVASFMASESTPEVALSVSC